MLVRHPNGPAIPGPARLEATMKRLRTDICLVALLLTVVPGSASSQTSPLAGRSWQLVRFQGGDEKVLTPDDRTKYTLEFAADGSVSARIDCNRGRGSWKSSGPSGLQFGPLALTRASCPPGSLHDQIVKQWPFIRSYVMKDGHLFLSLMADGGIYEFEPMAAAKPSAAAAQPIQRTAIYRERIAMPPDAVFEATLDDVSRADAAADVIGRTRVTSPGNPPIRFEITYDASRIQANPKYAVRARILAGEKVMFVTDSAPPVLTGGSGNTVTLTMRLASGGGAALQDSATPQISIEGRAWRLTRLRGQTDQAIAALQRPPTLRLELGKVQAFSGCNSLGGSYMLDGDMVRFGKLAGTMMACAAPVMTIEAAFNKALMGTLRVDSSGTELTLTRALDSEPSLVFVAEPIEGR
jgi:heat shock protein HslJ